MSHYSVCQSVFKKSYFCCYVSLDSPSYRKVSRNKARIS